MAISRISRGVERYLVPHTAGASFFTMLLNSAILFVIALSSATASFPNTTLQNLSSSSPWDAILFRTHFIDNMVLKKLRELLSESKAPSSESAIPWELVIVYDADVIPDFSGALKGNGFSDFNHVELFPTTLKTFTQCNSYDFYYFTDYMFLLYSLRF